ncbi:MAG: ABC transporter ATP-binding protein [Spirulinaceae cyanobacterium]
MSTNKLLLRFLSKYPFLVGLTVLLGFSGAIFNGVSTALVVPLLLEFLGQGDELFDNAPQALGKFMSLFDGFPEDKRLMALTGAVLLAILLKNVANYANGLVAGHYSRLLVNGIRLEGLKLLLDVDLDFFSKHRIGDIHNHLSGEVNRTAGAVRILIQMASLVMTIMVYVGTLILLSWQLTIAATFLLGLVSLCNQYFIKRAKSFGKELSEKSRAYSNAFWEILGGIRLIKTVSNENEEFERIKAIIRDREKADFQSQANFAIISPINELLGTLSVLGVVVIGGIIFSEEQMNALSTILLTYLVLLFRLLPIVGQLNGTRSRFANSAPSAEIVADFLNLDTKPFMGNGSAVYQRLEDSIEIENLSFAYPGQEKLVLKNVSIQVPKGQTIALVGASGAGKSTLADLIPRFYDPIEGRITLDGKDIREYDIASIRQQMGVVSQDTFLFNASIRNNIAYAMPQATNDDIIEASKRANAYEFIAELPHGLDTEIGDRGVLLSGGQRQRIAIARALLRNPDILILDEATSALDTVSERLVQQAIDELCRDRTTVVIAHRLSTIRKAHQIAVLDKGRVVEVGSHEELVNKKNGHYARLHSMQFSDKPKIVLPTNAALIRTSLRASHELRTRLSYEVRSRLNSMLGSLRLVTDDLVDSKEEQNELIEESYRSALHLLNTIEYFEVNGAKLPIER